MKLKTLCFTGHRSIPADKLEYVRGELRREIEAAIADGYTHFISGFADGVDQLAAALVLEQQRIHPNLHLEAAIPYRNRVKALLAKPGAKALLEGCTIVAVRQEDYSRDCFMLRNRYMVQNSSRLIAVYDGRPTGGTMQTIGFARIYELDIREIRI